MNTQRVPSLRDALAEVPDFRQAQGRRYELLPVLLLCCVVVMCGYRSQAAMAQWGSNYGRKWLQRLGITRRRGPSQATLHRIFKGLDCAPVERAVGQWAEQVRHSRPAPPVAVEGLALDGKTLCGSQHQGAADVHLLSALSPRFGVVLAQVAGADQTNEIGPAADLLAARVRAGRVITADSLLTQRALAQRIIERGGD